MATGIKVETKLPKEMRKLNVEYRQAVLQAIADHLDLVRLLAAKKYIIPDMYPNRSLRAKTRLQKTHPTKLTSRTGALLKMLNLGVDKWTKGTSRYSSKSPAVQAAAFTKNPGKTTESYVGTIGYEIKEPYQISKKRSARQLAGRFLWDLPGGVRGVSRPFLSAANEELGVASLERAARKRLSKLGVL